MSGFFSPVTAAGAVALGVLGARRRSHQPDGADPTVGEHFAAAANAGTKRVLGIANGASRFGTQFVASTAEAGGVAAAMTIRAASRLSDSVTSPALSLAAGAVTKAGGLVVDGVASIADILRKPLQGH